MRSEGLWAVISKPSGWAHDLLTCPSAGFTEMQNARLKPSVMFHTSPGISSATATQALTHSCSVLLSTPSHYRQIQFVLVLNQTLFFRQSSSCRGTTGLKRPPPSSLFYFSSQTRPFFSSGWLLELCTRGQNGGAAAVCRAVLFLIDDCWHFLLDSSVCWRYHLHFPTVIVLCCLLKANICLPIT